MDTVSLMEALAKINKKFNNKYRIGVFAADTLPQRCRKPAAIIQNMDGKTQSGSHWTATFLPARGKAEYFCSYGLPPVVKGHLNFLKRHSAGYIYNKKVLQQLTSTVCGHYCLLYLANRMSGVPMQKFIGYFDNQRTNNDMMTRMLGVYLLKKL